MTVPHPLSAELLGASPMPMKSAWLMVEDENHRRDGDICGSTVRIALILIRGPRFDPAIAGTGALLWCLNPA